MNGMATVAGSSYHLARLYDFITHFTSVTCPPYNQGWDAMAKAMLFDNALPQMHPSFVVLFGSQGMGKGNWHGLVLG